MSGLESALGVKAGTRINDRYEVEKLLGVGGFAAVFKAHDVEIERDVAIKILNVQTLVSQGNDLDVVLTRFKREAKTAAKINNPCVVQIYDFGVLEEGDNPFIIMELLNGHDLKEELKIRGTLDPTRIVPLFVDTLGALGEAHQAGIVHKDIKPTNLFLADPGTRKETLKLVDFGIAHIAQTEDENRLTKTGYMLGTPQYMAPEYVEEQQVSPALDVYQMGLLLVELLGGRPVVQEVNPWKCALMHVSRELSVPVQLLSSPLGPVLEKALALKPEDRYPTATEFADALELVDVTQVPTLSIGAESRFLQTPSSEVLAPAMNTQELLGEQDRPMRARVQTGMTRELGPGDPKVPAPLVMKSSESEGSKKGLIFLGVVVGVILVAAALLFSVLNTDDTDAIAAEVDVDAPLLDEFGRPMVAMAEDDAPAEEPGDRVEDEDPDEPTVEESEPVFVEVRLVPTSAELRVGGEVKGRGLVDLEFESDQADPVDAEITADGYVAQSVTIGPGEPRVTVELEEVPQIRREPRQPRDPAPTPDPDPDPPEDPAMRVAP